MPATPVTERRRSPRITWRANVKMWDESKQRIITSNAQLHNLSKNGLNIQSEEKLSPGSLCRVKINLFPVPVELTGRVVQVQPDSFLFLEGVTIENLSFFDRTQWNRFLAQHGASYQTRFFFYSLLVGVVGFAISKFAFGMGWGISWLTFSLMAIAAYVLNPF